MIYLFANVNRVLDTYPYIPVYDQMYNDDANYQYFTHVLSSYHGPLEFMCHPAYLDQSSMICPAITYHV